MIVVQYILLFLQFVISVLLVTLVVAQTPKSQGLGGSIGAPTTANFKGKPGFEDRLQGWAVKAGIAWFVVSIAVGIVYRSV